jgi:catechol 2,3-dioxygenase-like lactoylglutathione lyase family enzyme
MSTKEEIQLSGWLNLMPELPVTDMERSIAYYQEALGFRLSWRHVSGNLAAFTSGPIETLLLVGWAEDSAPPPATAYVYFDDPEWNGLRDTLAALGPILRRYQGQGCHREDPGSHPEGHDGRDRDRNRPPSVDRANRPLVAASSNRKKPERGHRSDLDAPARLIPYRAMRGVKRFRPDDDGRGGRCAAACGPGVREPCCVAKCALPTRMPSASRCGHGAESRVTAQGNAAASGLAVRVLMSRADRSRRIRNCMRETAKSFKGKIDADVTIRWRTGMHSSKSRRRRRTPGVA